MGHGPVGGGGEAGRGAGPGVAVTQPDRSTGERGVGRAALLVSEEQKQQQRNSGAMQGLGEAGLGSRAAALLEEGSWAKNSGEEGERGGCAVAGDELSRAATMAAVTERDRE